MRNPASEVAGGYPPADRFVEAFGEAQLRDWVARRNGLGQPLFVHLHLPLCGTPSCRCGSDQYTEYLARELALVAALIGRKPALAPGHRDCRLRARLEPFVGEGARTPLLSALGCDVLGCGTGAIGHVGAACYQNHESLDAYCAALDRGRLPVARGLELGADDLARRAAIEALACHLRVSIESLELSHLVDFRRDFAVELAALERFARAGLVRLAGDWIEVTPAGRPWLRAICSVFDRHRRKR